MASFDQLGRLLHQFLNRYGMVTRTDELNENPNHDDLPSTRDTVDHESCVSAEAKILVNGGSEVVTIYQHAWIAGTECRELT